MRGRIEIPGTTNLRDVGGLPAGAGTVASGRLLRSEVIVDRPSAHYGLWDEHNAELITGLGIRTVVDLRSTREVDATVSAWGRATGADVVALPIEEGGEGTDTNYVRQLLDGTLARFGVEDMSAFYVATLDRRGAVFAAAVGILAESGRLPVLVHCSAGKDRTGLLVAVVLEILGVPRADTVADYELTGVLRPDRVRAYAPMFDAAGVAPDDARVLFETPAAAMRAALAHLDDKYGGAAGYLRESGLTAAAVERVRSNLLVL